MEIKQKIHRIAGYSLECQLLFFNGKLQESWKILEKIGVKNKFKIYAVFRSEGKPWNRREVQEMFQQSEQQIQRDVEGKMCNRNITIQVENARGQLFASVNISPQHTVLFVINQIQDLLNRILRLMPGYWKKIGIKYRNQPCFLHQTLKGLDLKGNETVLLYFKDKDKHQGTSSLSIDDDFRRKFAELQAYFPAQVQGRQYPLQKILDYTNLNTGEAVLMILAGEALKTGRVSNERVHKVNEIQLHINKKQLIFRQKVRYMITLGFDKETSQIALSKCLYDIQRAQKYIRERKKKEKQQQERVDKSQQELQERWVKQKSNQGLCKVCLSDESSIIHLKCFHMCLCQTCAKGLNGVCPICRAKGQFQKVFRA